MSDLRIANPEGERRRVQSHDLSPRVWEDTAREAARRLAAIEALCRRHAHPGCNSGAHELACKALRIIRGENDA